MEESVDLAVGGGLSGLVLANRCAEQGLVAQSGADGPVHRGPDLEPAMQVPPVASPPEPM